MTFSNDAGQRQATYPTQLWNHQGKQEGALQGTMLTELENMGS